MFGRVGALAVIRAPCNHSEDGAKDTDCFAVRARAQLSVTRDEVCGTHCCFYFCAHNAEVGPASSASMLDGDSRPLLRSAGDEADPGNGQYWSNGRSTSVNLESTVDVVAPQAPSTPSDPPRQNMPLVAFLSAMVVLFGVGDRIAYKVCHSLAGAAVCACSHSKLCRSCLCLWRNTHTSSRK